MQDNIELTIIKPDDWHVHFRDGVILESVAQYTAKYFGRALLMPNLSPPLTNSNMANDYRQHVRNAVPNGLNFTPIMSCYLNDTVDKDDLIDGFQKKIWHSAKLYPAHATTNSQYGVTDITSLYPYFECMQKHGMILNIHGEVSDKAIDIFDREKIFIARHLSKIRRDFPELKIVLEHITTKDAVDFIYACQDATAATITIQHMILNRNALFDGGLRPHHYCLPVVKREEHRQAVLKAAISGDSRFFLGTDSAPHHKHLKESDCGCAGIFSAPTALSLYTQAFEEENALHHFEKFASLNGARFYNLPINKEKITLVKSPYQAPLSIKANDDDIIVFAGGQHLSWAVA